MIEMIQTTKVPVSGGGIDWQIVMAIIMVTLLLILATIWLYRRARKTIETENEWGYEKQSLMRPERRKPQPQASEAPPPASDASPELAVEVELEPALASVPAATLPEAEEPPDVVLAAPPLPVSQPVEGLEPALASPPPAVTPQPKSGQRTVFRTFEHRVEEEKRSRHAHVIVTIVVLGGLAAYLFIPSLRQSVNSVALSVSDRLGQLSQLGPATPAGEPTALPQLEVTQTSALSDRTLTITGEIRNLSSETFRDLVAELTLVRRDVNLPETRLVRITPPGLPPNAQGRFTTEVSAGDYSEYRLARILTGDRGEVPFRLSLTVPTVPARGQ
jgi:hypothetical protein